MSPAGERDGLAERCRAARRDPELAVLEGLHALKHALRFGGEIVEAWTRDPHALDRLARSLAPDVAGAIADLAIPIDDDAFAELAPSPHPTGVIALARRPTVDPTGLLAAPRPGRGEARDDDGPRPGPVVLLERPTHHGNIGAVVRVAAAAGATGVLVTGPHDPWHPSSIRGGAGLQFALPVASLEPDGVERAMGSERPVVVLDPRGEPLGAGEPGAVGPSTGDAGRKEAPGLAGALLVFGSERTGVSRRLLERADRRVSIPMRPDVSSLNLATAVAAVLYLAGAPFPSRP